MRRTLAALAFAALLAGVIFLSLPKPADRTQPEPEPKPEWIPFIYYAHLIYLPVQVNDRGDLLFLLDTGANVSAIDRGVARELALPQGRSDTVEGTAGTIDVEKARLARLIAAGHGINDIDVTVQDLGGLIAPTHRQVDGILGFDYLGGLSMKVDFAGQRIAVAARPAGEAFSPPSPSLAIPFELDNGIPRLHGTLGSSVECDFRLDTGASLFETEDVYLNITEDVWGRLRASNPTLTPEDSLHGSGAGGEIVLPVARIDRLRIGAATIPAPYVIVQPRQGYFARPDAVGFVSNNLLERYDPVVIDYITRQIHLTPR